MKQIDIDDLLDKLCPSDVLQPVKIKKEAGLVLDDTVVDDTKKNLYINGFQTDAQYSSLTMENLALRYTQGIRLLNSNNLTNISHLAHWQPSSYKIGNPIENVLDDNMSTFWQSDGVQPHELCIYFSKRMDISLIAIFISLIADESYTPRLIKMYVGHSPADALFYKNIEIRNINGWAALTFEDNRSPDNLLKCQFVRLVLPINHENGKDTHLRGIRIYSPSKTSSVETSEWIQSFDTNSKLFTEYSLR
ncbi:hypothetical protein Kpol_460p19 [Vanderwaltozyma polyspora DSM 70294]|uniref:DOC domain-containing protein n=1 Tax=Vanderwaltozyma polyspora (strain ATCC 22028 / DSM 70294 / BCRC 21397 / CBS 2163 / NBRC 10782 / NRRL Y-8283 / UCD 57-17) TaxID=436907 RepID=A7TQT5_VANPO|nr:uncharacterized protein Kpol_460p19 [Vanderwaltozyma polyspora DSM 70294]EDO15384.1 hypothetical protein Kpol_460p19 [Vanderwaltozyma polyspora DSM 70294]